MARARASKIVFDPSGFLQANQLRVRAAESKAQAFTNLGQIALNLSADFVGRRETRRREGRQDKLRQEALDLRADEKRIDRQDTLQARSDARLDRARESGQRNLRHTESLEFREETRRLLTERDERDHEHVVGKGKIRRLDGRISLTDEVIDRIKFDLAVLESKKEQPTLAILGKLEEAVAARNRAVASKQAVEQDLTGMKPDGTIADIQKWLFAKDVEERLARRDPQEMMQTEEQKRLEARERKNIAQAKMLRSKGSKKAGFFLESKVEADKEIDAESAIKMAQEKAAAQKKESEKVTVSEQVAVGEGLLKAARFEGEQFDAGMDHIRNVITAGEDVEQGAKDFISQTKAKTREEQRQEKAFREIEDVAKALGRTVLLEGPELAMGSATPRQLDIARKNIERMPAAVQEAIKQIGAETAAKEYDRRVAAGEFDGLNRSQKRQRLREIEEQHCGKDG